jgi:CrcB protein
MLGFVVALAAGVGAVLRYVIDRLAQSRFRGAFPYGTLVVNASGSLVLGLSTGLASRHGLAPSAAVMLGAGLAGGYTTLSTWAWETLALSKSGALRLAVVNIVGSFAAGLAAGAVGLGLALL